MSANALDNLCVMCTTLKCHVEFCLMTFLNNFLRRITSCYDMLSAYSLRKGFLQAVLGSKCQDELSGNLFHDWLIFSYKLT